MVKLTREQLQQAWNETAAEGHPPRIIVHPSDILQFAVWVRNNRLDRDPIFCTVKFEALNTATPGAIKFTSTYPNTNITVEICFDEEKC